MTHGGRDEQRKQARKLAHEARQAAHLARRTALQGWGAPQPPDTAKLRVGDAERSAVADALQEHYAQGRLDPEELDDRLTRALAAKTGADLTDLLDDLPGPHPWPPQPIAPPYAPHYRERRKGPHGLPFAIWAIMLIGFPLMFALGGAGAAFVGLRVLLLVGLIALIVKLVKGSRR
ncbi:DUF1707 domain-containing protein [Actinocorallia sp. A-T 12471]|uniref:DUF1707 SHOCT-like domain-containing protein n=1 Tax=Actinocorallia sp. A-T 12471 TaxID=3089813 RepID=UPI0029D20CD1|nr:DUF1707 domain-containing protein [Actinocorallia sp. A-T 12471]MDX6739720.1 DUF1707 domain-containing protein [Actinocorallia sp. A-T 12471]